ncbi:hypothetical protein scyTo_0017728, partial [Scyliorhinus torazame]|nr:hypothetical protein [Scyliorhinus torazame]
GCLFEERLCSHEELCVNDGLFGHCQDVMVPARTQYDISAAVLQRLQEILKQLMLQGLSWQDDITQYVISMEMEKVPKLRPKQQRLTVPLADERFQWPAGRGVYPVGASMSTMEQWPPSLIHRYLQLILHGNQHQPHPESRFEGGMLEPYLFPKSGNVFQPSVEQERNHHWRADHLDSKDRERPADYVNSYDLSYGEIQDANQKQPNRVKGQSTGLRDPRPQE